MFAEVLMEARKVELDAESDKKSLRTRIEQGFSRLSSAQEAEGALTVCGIRS